MGAHAPSEESRQWDEAMRRDWNERARSNAMHYVESSRDEWDEDDFFASGRESVRRFVDVDLPLICGGRDAKELAMLEIGCGVGRMTVHLAEIFGHVDAIDISDEMIAIARRHLGAAANVSLHVTSGRDLAPFGDRSFDFCFSFIVFQHIPDRSAVIGYLREAHRTLRRAAIFKFQVQGVLLEEVDTWVGAGFSEEEMRTLADEIGFDVVRMSGQGTQYFWNVWRRR